MAINATRLRQNLYRVLDTIIETGVPVEITRKGHTLKIVPEKPVSKWDRLERHSIVNGDPDDLVHIDWSTEWKGKDALS
jgi:antitoxin (DNA-binding transcriptional repressor) of toxin-antitoxin stability system